MRIMLTHINVETGTEGTAPAVVVTCTAIALPDFAAIGKLTAEQARQVAANLVKAADAITPAVPVPASARLLPMPVRSKRGQR
jgi:hypothetical protein